MKKRISLLLCLIMVFTMLSGCSSNGDKNQTSNTTEKKAKDTITMITSAEADSLDPRRGNSMQNGIPMEMIYDTLVKYKTDGTVEPGLATSWEFVDPTHLKMNLRKDVKFSNGYPLTAQDVYFSFERTKHDSTSISTMSWLDIEKTKVVDDYTIILAMYKPYSPALYVLGNGRTYVASKKAMEEMGEKQYALTPVGTGPYKLVKWETGSKMTFERNDNYWGTPAKTKNVTLKIVPEAASRVIELETGSADFAYYIDGSDADRVEALDGYHIQKADSERYFLITLSMKEPLFQDEKIRYALSYATDIKSLTDVGFNGSAKPLTGLYAPIVFGFKDYGKDYMPYDPNKAKQLLAEAGYPNGFEIELHVQPSTQFQRLAEAVQAMWAKVGVKAKIVTSELATYEAQKKGQFQAAIRDGNANEVSNILIIYEIAFGSRLQPNDKVLDDMLQKVKTIYDAKEKAAYLAEVQDYIYKKRTSIPFAMVPAIYGVSDKLQGVKVVGRVDQANIKDWVLYE